MGIVVDTSTLIGIERRSGDPSVLRELALSEPLVMGSISLSELLVGGLRANSESRRLLRERFVERTLALLGVMPFDANAAQVHARILAHLVASGQQIGAHDLLIAATALALDYGVLTDNVRDFERVPGLTVVHPNWRP